MVQTPVHHPPFPLTDADARFMQNLADDTEEAPWMIMGDLQFWSASGLAHSLRHYAQRHGQGWYVASMLPIRYYWPPRRPTTLDIILRKRRRKKVLAPDVLVAFIDDHARTSLDADIEGFPPFVMEVVSPSSVEHDARDKRKAYEILGVREYVLFTPQEEGGSHLAGYRRNATGQFEDWPLDAEGRLWSAVSELYLVARGSRLQAQTAAGEWLLTPEQEAAARQRAEAEVERLRQELAHYRRLDGRPDDGPTAP
jgi:hypothetical protein